MSNKASPLTSIYKKSNTIIEMLLSYPKIPLMNMDFFLQIPDNLLEAALLLSSSIHPAFQVAVLKETT
jgi:hypothetical protein